MKLKYPIVWALIILILVSYITSLFGLIATLLPLVVVILAIGNTVHSIEEYFTQIWIESPNSVLPIFHNSNRTQSQLDGPLFVMISIYFNALNWALVYILYYAHQSWVLNYGVILLVITIINGIIHLIPVIKNKKYNSGVISIWVTIIATFSIGLFLVY